PIVTLISSYCSVHPGYLHSFPTRRSSDLMDKVSRRTFFGTAGSAVLPMTARAYSRIRGANDRIQIAQIGCGNRAQGHRQMLKLRSEEHTSELQSRRDLVCRLLLEKKK